MRQAGRVLKEYRATREQAGSFKALLKNPQAACKVTIQPVDILLVDAAILFSDILVIPEALGLPYQMEEGTGPWFEKTIQGIDDVNALSTDRVEENLDYVFQTIRLIKQELNNRVPLIGFAGAPWTLMCYMVDGKGTKTFTRSRAMLFQNPELAHTLLTRLTQATIIYLKRQIAEGCDMVQLFDSWAGILTKELYNTFSLPYLQKICDAITGVPVTIFAKGASFSLRELSELNCNTIGLDWQTDIHEARKICGSKKTLQGNLDPAVLYGDFPTIEKHTGKMLEAFGPHLHIANLGHGVYPDTDVEKLKCFIQTVQSYNHKQQ